MFFGVDYIYLFGCFVEGMLVEDIFVGRVFGGGYE